MSHRSCWLSFTFSFWLDYPGRPSGPFPLHGYTHPTEHRHPFNVLIVISLSCQLVEIQREINKTLNHVIGFTVGSKLGGGKKWQNPEVTWHWWLFANPISFPHLSNIIALIYFVERTWKQHWFNQFVPSGRRAGVWPMQSSNKAKSTVAEETKPGWTHKDKLA